MSETHYFYNKDGIRIKKESGDKETNYFVENSNIVYEEREEGVLFYKRSEENELVGISYQGKEYYYKKNNQNDIIGLYNSEYKQIASYTYDSYGKIISIKDADGIINATTDCLSNNLYIYTNNNYIKFNDKSGYLIHLMNPIKLMKKCAQVTAKIISFAVGKIKNMTASSNMLNSALDGKNLNEKTKEIVINKVKNSSEMKNEINKCISNNKDKNSFVCKDSVNDSTGFVSDLDLHGAIGKADYIIQGERNAATKTIELNVTISDTYDFDDWRWTLNWLDWANNFGVAYQTLGLLTPYQWDISYSLTIPDE